MKTVNCQTFFFASSTFVYARQQKMRVHSYANNFWCLSPTKSGIISPLDRIDNTRSQRILYNLIYHFIIIIHNSQKYNTDSIPLVRKLFKFLLWHNNNDNDTNLIKD